MEGWERSGCVGEEVKTDRHGGEGMRKTSRTGRKQVSRMAAGFCRGGDRCGTFLCLSTSKQLSDRP